MKIKKYKNLQGVLKDIMEKANEFLVIDNGKFKVELEKEKNILF